MNLPVNKKVLLRERKRHTARRVAITISCYSRGGRGGSLDKIFFSQSEHVSSQIWCKKFFPLLRPGPPPLPPKIWDWEPPPKSETWDPPRIWDRDLGTPPPHPPPPEMWTHWKCNLPSSFGWRAVKILPTQILDCGSLNFRKTCMAESVSLCNSELHVIRNYNDKDWCNYHTLVLQEISLKKM